MYSERKKVKGNGPHPSREAKHWLTDNQHQQPDKTTTVVGARKTVQVLVAINTGRGIVSQATTVELLRGRYHH